MKVRITQDAIRIRLNQTEVRTLGEGHGIEMQTIIDGATGLRSILRPASSETTVVSMQPFTLVVDVPRQQLMAWANGDSITLESRHENGVAGGLGILIEKDFHCLHRDTADDADTFPNPKQR
jgi:hypothetical protein